MSHSRHLLVIAALLLGACAKNTDDPLIEAFESKRATLDELVLMFKEDPGLARVGMNYSLPEDPADVEVSFDRLKEYRELCKKIDAKGCIEGYDSAYELLTAEEAVDFSDEKTVIWIHLDEHDASFHGKTMGYLYSEEPPFQVVDDLDDIRPTKSSTWLRQIDGPWYLYMEFRE